MAAPYVAGAAALLLERAPNSTPVQVKANLAGHARDLSLSTFAQGSGELDLQAALNSSVAISYDPLALGLLEPAAPDLLETFGVQFTNSTPSSVAYDMSFDRPLPAGFNITPSSSRLVIAPGQTVTLNLGVQVQNGVLPAAPTYPCDYSGTLIARSETDTIRFPFALLKGAVFNFSVQDAAEGAPPPYAVLLHNRKGWVQWHRYMDWSAGPMMVILPPDDYDVIACYFGLSDARDAGILVKENLNLESRMDVSLDGKQVTNLLKFQPSYPPGATHSRAEELVAVLRHKSTGFTLPVHSGSSIHASTISHGYSLELLMVNDGTPSGKPLFTFHAALPDGVQGSATFQNDPADFRHARIDHSLRTGSRSLESIIFLDLDSMRMAVSVSRLAARDFYLALPPSAEFSTGGLSELVLESDGQVLYSTGRWRAVSRSVLASYPLGEERAPVASTESDFIPAAVGPYYWFGRFENQPDQVRVLPSVGWDPFLMRGQCGDYFTQESLAYDVRRDGGTTAGTPAYPLQGERLPSVLAVDPGAYTMTITLPDPAHPGNQAKVTARFDTTRADPDPPYLRAFRLTKRDELSEVLSAAFPRTLWFKAGDNETLQRVEIWLDQGTGSRRITTVPEGPDEFRAELPRLATSASAELRLEMEDNSGNLLRFETRIWGASPDLTVWGTGQQKALIGRNARFEVRVANTGLDSTDSEVSLTQALPAGLTFVSATAEDWTCAPDGQRVGCRRSKPLFAKTESALSFVVAVGREAYPSVSTRFEVGNTEDRNAENNVSLLSSSVDGTTWWTGLGPAGGEVYSLATDSGNPEVLYAGVFGQIYRSGDHGKSWSPLSHGLPDVIITTIAVKPGNPQVIFAGTDGWGAWKSSDGGRNWTPVKSQLLEDAAVRVIRFHPGHHDTLYAGLVGKALRSTDGGTTWTALNIDPLPVTFSDIAVNPQRSSTIYAGSWQKIYVSTDNGATWRVSQQLSLGTSGLTSGSANFGRLDKWLRFAFDPDDPLSVWANSLTALYKTTDGGSTWERNPVPFGFLFGTAISVTHDPQRTMYVAFNGRIVKSTDRGKTWQELPVAEVGFVDDLLVAGDGSVFAANAAGVQASSDKGDTWVACGDISAIQAQALAFDPGSPGSVLASTDAGIVTSVGGSGWELLDGTFAANVLVADPHKPGTFYAAGAGVWKSSDRGKSWDASSQGLEGTSAMNSISALVADPRNPGYLYLGTGNQTVGGEGVFKSTDAGGSWTHASSGLPALPGVSCLAIDPETGRLYAGVAFWGATGAQYGLYRSTKAEAGWNPISVGLPRAKINAIVFAGSGSSRTLLVGTEGSGVYRSEDQGSTWKPSSTGMPEESRIRAIAVDADGVTYAAGYGAGVFVSRNGGRFWTAFAEGLSNNWVTSLVLDPLDNRTMYVSTSTGVFSISPAPDFSLAATRSEKLLSGGAGVWSINVANVGSGTSRDAIGVNLEMPEGLRLLKSSGFGWNCTAVAGRITCSTGERVDPKASLATLDLTFEIDENAPSAGATTIRVESRSDVAPGNDSLGENLQVIPGIVSRIPLFRADSHTFVGLALANPGADRRDVVLTVLDQAGSLVDLPGNPAFLTLEPGTQLAQLSSELFGPARAPIEQAWVRIASDQPIGATYQLGGPHQLDGGVGQVKKEKLLYFTRACQGETACLGFTGRTVLALANPNSGAVTVRAVLSSARSGLEREVIRLIPGKASLAGDLSELFGVETVTDGFVKVEVVEGAGIVGSQLIELTESASLVSLPALAPGIATSLYSAQLADIPGLSTSLRLINTGELARTVRVAVIGDDGELLAQPREVTFDGMTSLEEDAGGWFEWVPGKERVGSLKIEADGPGIIGSVIFGAADGQTAAALPLDSGPVRRATFSQVANGMGVFTGIAVFNPGSESVELTLRVFTAEGTQSGDTTVTLQPGRRLSRQVSELLPMTEGQIGGYITLTATGPVVAQELFGGSDFLSAVPPSTR